jgi:hypothetical protein
VLVDEDGVPVGIDDDEAPWTGTGLVDLADELDSLGLQAPLELADIRE